MAGGRRDLARPVGDGPARRSGEVGGHVELAATQVLHPTDRGSPGETTHGTREFATLDRDGNLLTFFARP
ncbi:MAG: hypothetical protein ACXWDM_12780 [Nocardioides sp.]